MAQGKQGIQGEKGDPGPSASKANWLRVIAVIALSVWLAGLSYIVLDAVSVNNEQTEQLTKTSCANSKDSRQVFLDGFDVLTKDAEDKVAVRTYRARLVKQLEAHNPVCALAKEKK